MSELFYLHWERFWLGVIYMVYKLARSAKAGLNTILPYSVLCLGMNLSRSESSARPRPAPRLRSPALLLLGNWRSAYIVGVPRTFFGAISCCSPAPAPVESPAPASTRVSTFCGVLRGGGGPCWGGPGRGRCWGEGTG